jgi:hypothetical protein
MGGIVGEDEMTDLEQGFFSASSQGKGDCACNDEGGDWKEKANSYLEKQRIYTFLMALTCRIKGLYPAAQ